MAHGFGLTRRSGLRVFAESVAAAGYAVLLFDYRMFGDSEGEPRQLISFQRQLQDWAAAVDFVSARPEVDAGAIATWGFSLGGGHAVMTAAHDPRVRAVVAVTPMLSGIRSTLAAMRWWSLRTVLRLFVLGLGDVFASIVRRPSVRVPLTAPAGALGILTSPDAYPGYRAIVPHDFDFMTGARIGLHFWTYNPGRVVRRMRVPVLLMPSSVDRVCPPGSARRQSRGCSHVTTITLDCDHMEAVGEANRLRVVDATTRFLRTHLRPSSSTRDASAAERLSDTH